MAALRKMAKKIVTLFIGTESRPRRILRGLPRGYKIIVSPEENLGCLLGTQETHLQNIIRKYVLPGQTVYDIGANMGFVSLSLSRRVGLTGTVVAFEPLPQNLRLLSANVAENGISNIQILEMAASNRCGEAVINLTDNVSTASLVWHSNDPSVSRYTVKTAAIDELVRAGTIAEPSFVKIDVEGAEGLVLEGMRQTIATARPTIFVECSDIGRQTAWNLLRNIGYQCYRATTLRQVESFEEYRHADFLWIPAHRG